jgi:serine/threonine protein kinase
VQYAAPEQLGAKRIKLHKTTDLYALATTYYALRTGKFPWSDEADEPIEKLKYDEHFDFSALDRLNRYRYEADVLRRALRCDPRQRPPSVTDFLGDLERAIGQEALAEAAARRRRRQLASWSAVAVLLLALAAAGFYKRDDLARLVQQRTHRDDLSALLLNDDWDGAVQLVAKSDQLTTSEESTATPWKQLTDELGSHKLEGDLALVQRAMSLPDKLKTRAFND